MASTAKDSHVTTTLVDGNLRAMAAYAARGEVQGGKPCTGCEVCNPTQPRPAETAETAAPESFIPARDTAIDAMQCYFPNGGRDYDSIAGLYAAILAGDIPGISIKI